MKEHLQKQMMDLAENNYDFEMVETYPIKMEYNEYQSARRNAFHRGFQAAAPLIRAEYEGEIKELELLNNIEVERLIRETDRSAKLLELIKHALELGHLGDGSTKAWAEELVKQHESSK